MIMIYFLMIRYGEDIEIMKIMKNSIMFLKLHYDRDTTFHLLSFYQEQNSLLLSVAP